MKVGLIACLVLATQSAGGTPARAQQPTKAGIDPLLDCRSIEDSQQRLTCFDRQSENLRQAIASGTIVILDKQAVRSARRSLFGLEVNLPFFRGDDDQEREPREITAEASFVREVGMGYWQVGLDNGAVWQTTEPMPRVLPPRAGETITIRKGIAGGYFLKSGSTLVRAKRTK